MSHSIITGSGDDGTTGLLSGKRVSKTDLRIEACGAVHELSTQLGVLRTHLDDASDDVHVLQIEKIQFILSVLCGQIASDGSSAIESLKKENIAEIEKETREMEETLPTLTQFILPGGTITAAHAHLASAVCRRAERRLVGAAEDKNLFSDNLNNGGSCKTTARIRAEGSPAPKSFLNTQIMEPGCPHPEGFCKNLNGLIFLNRLSDYLFVLARRLEHEKI